MQATGRISLLRDFLFAPDCGFFQLLGNFLADFNNQNELSIRPGPINVHGTQFSYEP